MLLVHVNNVVLNKLKLIELMSFVNNYFKFCWKLSFNYIPNKNKFTPTIRYFSQLHASKKHPTTKRSAKKSQGDDEIEVLSDDEFENFIKSEKGQKQLDNELNMKDHVYK